MASLWPLVWPIAIMWLYDHAKFDVNWQVIDRTASTNRATLQKECQHYVVESFLKKAEPSSYAESAAPWL